MFCFPYLRVGDQGFGGFEVVGTLLGGLGSGLESGGGSESVLCGFCVGRSPGPGVCVPVLRQGYICRVKDSGGRHSCLVEVS